MLRSKLLWLQVDTHIPVPQRALDKPFQMPIEDTFSIAGRGTVVTGRVEQGALARMTLGTLLMSRKLLIECYCNAHMDSGREKACMG